MLLLRPGFLVAGLLILSGARMELAAQSGGCKDPATRWFFYPQATMPDGTSTVNSTIKGDGGWYTNGALGINAVIHICGSNPTDDSTIVLGSRRKLTFEFPAPIPGSVLQESLPGAPLTFRGGTFLNVRNILCRNCSVDRTQPFTSRLGVQIDNLVGRDDYRLRFMPLLVDAPDLHTDPSAVPGENIPYSSSPVLVIPQPYNCPTGPVKPAWIVRGTNSNNDLLTPGLQVGTLRKLPSIHAGQYYMPFEFRIEALTCFTY